MSIFQKMVSGSRRRYDKEGYNIDLSYICEGRIIVMSYPASGFKTNWRNDYREVSHNCRALVFLQPYPR